jgi:hypothetical protein
MLGRIDWQIITAFQSIIIPLPSGSSSPIKEEKTAISEVGK